VKGNDEERKKKKKKKMKGKQRDGMKGTREEEVQRRSGWASLPRHAQTNPSRRPPQTSPSLILSSALTKLGPPPAYLSLLPITSITLITKMYISSL
jgi:hypothetical protein